MHWRRKWQPTPVFLPGESLGQRSLASYGPWSHAPSRARTLEAGERWARLAQARILDGILAFTLELVERSLKDSEEWRAMTQPVPSVMRMGCLSALQKWESGAR